MDSIPEKLRPLIRRLESVPDLDHQDLVSILFVVRLGDSLHKNFYATFLAVSLVNKLCDKLGIPDLSLEVEVFSLRWSFRQGTVSVTHRILWDYDMYSVGALTSIARGVLKDTLTPKEGLRFIRDVEVQSQFCKVEKYYRDFPGRALVIPLMAASCATVFFGGTWYDFGFSFACGLAAGLVAWIGAVYDQLTGIVDYMAALFTSMIAIAAILYFPNSACYSAQVLGTLYWFLYGTAYVLSLYEITNNQLITGATRFVQAILRSYGLAFGSMVGSWISSFYVGNDTIQAIQDECSTKDSQIRDLWFILLFPMAGIACLMQFRVGLNHFPICLFIQTVAYGSQYLIGTVWKQPDFLANMIPAYLTALVSHFCLVIVHRFQLSAGLEVDKYAYIQKKKTDQWDVDSLDESQELNTQHDSKENLEGDSSSNINFIKNSGWAKGAVGYAPDDELSYARSDSWFCLLPALYLLVPGAKVLQSAFMDLLAFAFGTGNASEAADFATSVLIIGLSQVIGLRLGFATLYVWNCFCRWMEERNTVGACCSNEKTEQSVVIHDRPAIMDAKKEGQSENIVERT